MMYQRDLQKTAHHWETQGSWQSDRGQFWLELQCVQQRLNRKITGDTETDWTGYTLEHHFSGRLPLQRCLSLGCGEGGLERQLASQGAFVDCDAWDIAAGSIASAQHAAQEAGFSHLHYSVRDINKIELAVNSYDAIWAAGSVHHFTELEHIFSQIAHALKPGAFFILHEYVGPSRFQFPAYQRQVIQACLDLLPPAYRQIPAQAIQERPLVQGNRNPAWLLRRVIDKWQRGDLLAAICRRWQLLRAYRAGTGLEKASVNLPTERSVIAVDPSEAVRSAEIVPTLQRYFDIIEYKPLGGTILQFLLADIAGNFETEDGEPLLQMLFTIEDTLMATGDLPSDFAYIVARPRNGQASEPAVETQSTPS